MDSDPRPSTEQKAERFIIGVGHGLKRRPPYRIFNGALPCATSYQRTEPLNPSIIATAAKPPRPVDGIAPETDLLVRTILDSLDDAKAEDVVAIDLRGKTSLADTMVVATGRSSTHVGAIADRLLRQCKSAGTSTRVEGLSNCDWVLVDAGDAIIHIFRPEVRQFYNLEKMWGGLRPDEQHQHAG